MLLPHLASRLYGTPLLLARAKLDVLLAVLGERIGWPETLAALPIPLQRGQVDSPTGLAVIPIHGTLVRRTSGLEAASGLTSYGEIGSALDLAVSDPSVSGILLDIDSPGGEAGGVFELARQIRAADTIKPVWAMASDAAYSAAYALACSASRVFVTETGGVGSIGVIAMHVDQSVRDAQEGYRYTPIQAGKRKNDFSPHEKLSSEAEASLQAEVDRLYGLFVDHVAAMRKLEPSYLRSTEAGVFFGPEAVTAGLADAEASFDQVIAEFATHLAGRQASARTAPLTPHTALPITKEIQMSHASSSATPPVTPVSPDDPTSAAPPEVPDDTGLEAVARAASQAARADAVAIAELCQLAGQPQRIAAFLAEGASEASVRRALLATRAESPEITSAISTDAPVRQSADSSNLLTQAVRKLIGKV